MFIIHGTTTDNYEFNHCDWKDKYKNVNKVKQVYIF